MVSGVSPKPREILPSVLVVNSSKTRREHLCRILEEGGFRVEEASTSSHALCLARRQPSLILLDVNLHDVDGFEVCRALRADPHTSHIAVILTSATPFRPRNIAECFNCGADDYLDQPISEEELTARILARIRYRSAELKRTNILHRQHAEATRAKLTRLRAALEIARLGIWEFTGQLGVWQRASIAPVLQLDERCRELFGLYEDRFFSIDEVLALLHPDDRDRVEMQLRSALEQYGGGVFDAECRILRRDGTERWVAMRALEVTPEIPDTSLVRYVGTLMDITERKHTQDLLVRSEKIAALGRMAATLAHEINNPLAAVVNSLFLARSSPDCPPSLAEYLDLADEQAKQICNITRRALGFYRENSTPTEVTVGTILDETIDTFQGRLKSKGVTVQGRYDGDLQVSAVGGELRQVFSNLIANSLDAMADHGTIKIRASRSASLGNGHTNVRVTVADDGYGIEPAAMPHLFEPLFTTKGSVGTGLGLWVSKQIIEKYGGSIRVRSSTAPPRRGTVFSVVLPSAEVGKAPAVTRVA